MYLRLVSTLARASLIVEEERALERAVAALEAKLGDQLLAVWLYGSRARGERPGEDSDIDLLVVVSHADKSDRVRRIVYDAVGEGSGDPFLFSTQVTDPRRLAEEAAIESLYLREVERDRIVLWGGECTPLAQLDDHELPPRLGQGGS